MDQDAATATAAAAVRVANPSRPAGATISYDTITTNRDSADSADFNATRTTTTTSDWTTTSAAPLERFQQVTIGPPAPNELSPSPPGPPKPPPEP